MRLIIDGYNVIFAAVGHKFRIRNPRTTRERLLADLARFKVSTGDEITVVFDGTREAISPRQDYHGVTVLFSNEDTDADHMIMNLVSHDEKPHTIRVVTSDNSLRAFVKRFGCEVEDAADFAERLEATLKTGQSLETPEPEPIEKFDGISDAEVEYWLKYFEEAEPEDG